MGKTKDTTFPYEEIGGWRHAALSATRSLVTTLMITGGQGLTREDSSDDQF